MSVLKSQRKESKFEVFHHFYKMRKEITNLVYRNFGYKGTSDFERWLIDGEAKAILNSLREAQKFITLAYSLYIFSNVMSEENFRIALSGCIFNYYRNCNLFSNLYRLIKTHMFVLLK